MEALNTSSYDKKVISILTSVYFNNDEETTLKFLEAVALQVIPESYRVEFLICNDGASDALDRLVDEFIDKNSRENLSIKKIINGANKGITHSLNRLYKISEGNIVVFIDADAIPVTQYWLDKLTRPIIENRSVIVQGNFWKQHDSQSYMARMHEKWRKSAYLSRHQNVDGSLKTFNTRNLAVARNVLVGMAQPTGDILNTRAVCGADTELGYRVAKAGFRVDLHPEAEVGHCDPLTFKEILAQKIRHGYNDGKIGISYPNSFYYVVWLPFKKSRVSLLFSIPLMLVFKTANIIGLIKRKINLFE